MSKTRQPLSPERIIEKAAALVRKEGAGQLSLRKIAAQLHVTPMAIYRHFDGKDALMNALFDRFISSAHVLPEKPLAWDAWLRHVGHAMHAALVREPHWLSLMSGLQPSGSGFEVLLACLEIMKKAGFTAKDTLEAFFTMVHIAVGAATLEVTMRGIDRKRPFDVSAEATKMLASQVSSVDAVLAAHHVDRSLDLLIEALTARLKTKS
jgi:AcrR family transcriptional regulator